MVNNFSGSYPDGGVHNFFRNLVPTCITTWYHIQENYKNCYRLLFYFVQEEKSVICVLLRRASESFKNRSASFMFVFL